MGVVPLPLMSMKSGKRMETSMSKRWQIVWKGIILTMNTQRRISLRKSVIASSDTEDLSVFLIK